MSDPSNINMSDTHIFDESVESVAIFTKLEGGICYCNPVIFSQIWKVMCNSSLYQYDEGVGTLQVHIYGQKILTLFFVFIFSFFCLYNILSSIS